MGSFDDQIIEFTRKGSIDKAKWLQNIGRVILPSHAERIKSNDRSVMRELVVPKWVTWDILREWAAEKKSSEGEAACAICGAHSALGMQFQEKFICENCFMGIKSMK